MADLQSLREQMKKRKEIKSSFASQQNPPKTAFVNNSNSHDAEYHYHLATCFDNGSEGYSEDLEKAFREYEIAANLGHSEAMLELAIDYVDEEESILGYNLAKAEDWARKAINFGNPDGYNLLYDIYVAQNKNSEALILLEMGVEKGSLDCIEKRAWMLYWGENEKGEDIECAEEAAYNLIKDKEWTDNHILALELLGYYHNDNDNPVDAKKCFERILKKNEDHFRVMAALGNLLRSEEPIRDYSRALILLRTAAQRGNFYAMNQYGVMLFLGEGADQNETEAIKWFKKSAEGGNTQAMINLGDIYADDNIKEARYWYEKASEYGDPRSDERLQKLEDTNGAISITDTSRSDKIYDSFLNNLDNTFNLTPSHLLNSGFPNRIEGIQKVIEKGDLSDYEIDRLKILQGWLSLCYFRHHFLDDDFDEQEDDYYKILDRVDDFISSMSEITDEGAYIYYIANMYSADRFKDVDPTDKLKELWGKLSEINLDEEVTEFKVQFWHDFAQDVYSLMSELHTPNNYSSESKNSNEDIKDRVISLVAKTLGIEEDEVHLYSRLDADLGADSLDAVELIMEVEKEFGLTIPEEAAEKIRTIGDIVSYLQRRI